MSKVIHKIAAALALGALLQISVLSTYASATNGNLKLGLKNRPCAEQLTSVRYRTELLGIYKLNEVKKHAVLHKKWQTRIAYAGQWVPTEASKTREKLYELDKLNTSIVTEVDSEIHSSQKLPTTALDCTTAKRGELQKRVNVIEANNLKLNNLQKEYASYQGKQFAKQSQKMLKKLHAEKNKHPKSTYSKLDVK